jgi:hypothetical protein
MNEGAPELGFFAVVGRTSVSVRWALAQFVLVEVS